MKTAWSEKQEVFLTQVGKNKEVEPRKEARWEKLKKEEDKTKRRTKRGRAVVVVVVRKEKNQGDDLKEG